MRTLTSPVTSGSSKITSSAGLLFSEQVSVNRPQISFLFSKKVGHLSLCSQLKTIQPLAAVSADAQVQLETGAENQEIYESKTVHVRFQLQKECMFGEQFLIAGDDPMFGLWDPKCAIPLNWSEGHVWKAELDIPVGKSIQFKLILKDKAGNVLWQPGPDRIFKTWESESTISVCEDWENAELQKISEESQQMTDDESTDYSRMIAAEKEENNESAALVADNIGYTMENPMVNASNNIQNIASVETNYTVMEGDILNGRAADVEGNLIDHEGGAVLVPGLIPMQTEGETEEDENAAIDASSIGISEAKNHDLPELDEKQEPESETINGEEQEHEAELSQMPSISNEQQPQPDAMPSESSNILQNHIQSEQIQQRLHISTENKQPETIPSEDNVLQNDLQWGRRTLQMLLSSLRLM